MSVIPNLLTSLRLILVPVFIVIFAVFPQYPSLALLVYVIAMFTDALDGRIARAYNCVSEFGTLVDPLADKLMTLAAVVCLTWSRIIPLTAMVLVAIREITMICIGAYAAHKDIVRAACIPGKVATVMFTVSLVLLFPWHGIEWFTKAAEFMLYSAIIVAFYAAIYYLAILVKRMNEKVGVR